MPQRGHGLDVTPDPYSDLLDIELRHSAGEAARERAQLSDADSRLLDALSRPAPPVVTAVEDEPPTVRAARDDRGAPLRPRGDGPLAPVFREPAG